MIIIIIIISIVITIIIITYTYVNYIYIYATLTITIGRAGPSNTPGYIDVPLRTFSDSSPCFVESAQEKKKNMLSSSGAGGLDPQSP